MRVTRWIVSFYVVCFLPLCAAASEFPFPSEEEIAAIVAAKATPPAPPAKFLTDFSWRGLRPTLREAAEVRPGEFQCLGSASPKCKQGDWMGLEMMTSEYPTQAEKERFKRECFDECGNRSNDFNQDGKPRRMDRAFWAATAGMLAATAFSVQSSYCKFGNCASGNPVLGRHPSRGRLNVVRFYVTSLAIGGVYALKGIADSQYQPYVNRCFLVARHARWKKPNRAWKYVAGGVTVFWTVLGIQHRRK